MGLELDRQELSFLRDIVKESIEALEITGIKAAPLPKRVLAKLVEAARHAD